MSELPIGTLASEQSQAVIVTGGSILQDSVFPKLKGINIFVEDWINWNSTILSREMDDIKLKGFNFVRTNIMFYRFYDFATGLVSPNRDTAIYNKTVAFLNTLKDKGLFVSVVPCEWGDYLNIQEKHWYTDINIQNTIFNYYKSFSSWCKDNDWNNILYVSLWWEPEYNDKWYDGYYTLNNNLTSFDDADTAWGLWLASNNETSANLSLASINSNINLYVSWSRQVFTNITQLKSNAVKAGWSGMKVGADVGFVNNPNNSPMYLPDAYLNLTGNEYLDVIEFHDYFPQGFVDTPFLAAVATLNKPVVMGEVGPSWWLGIDATTTDQWKSNVLPKMQTMLDNANGFAIWCWRDYSAFAWGMKDSNFVPRQILNEISAWLAIH